MAIKIGGIISGVDTDSVIQQLMAIDARGKTKLETKKKTIEDKKGIVGDMETRLNSIKSQADSLLLSSTFQKRSVSSTDTSIASATVADGATPGTYAIMIDRLATQSTNKSTAETNTNASRRSTQSVTPGTSPLDLSKSFASAGFVSTLDTSTTVTITDEMGGTYTSGMLSSYASVQNFIDEANTGMAGINVWYDSSHDRFNFERKNTPGGTITMTEDMANGLFTSTYVTQGMTAANETGLDSSATLDSLNTDAAVSASGTLTINGTGIAYTVGTDTLSGLITKINNQSATTGVSAYYDQTLDKVVMSRTTEGPQSIILTDTGNVLAGLKLTGATTVGSTALISINGDTITSDSNTYTFNGVTINLKQQGDNDGTVEGNGDDKAATLNVTQDTASVSTAIKSFVTTYNDFADFLKENSSYDSATKTAGKLFGDSLVSSIESRLKRLLFQSQSGLTSTTQLLAQLGIQLGDFNSPDANHLVVNDTKLTTAIAGNAPAVEALFGRSKSGSLIKNAGIAYDISSYVNELTKFQGLVDLRSTFLDNQIQDIDKRMSDEDTRLTRIEDSLRRQFGAMEQALAKINAQGSTVSQQLAKL